MELLFIGIIILVSIITLELLKHMVTRTTLKIVIILIVGIVIFLSVVGSLTSENLIQSDNEYIETGAAIAQSIQEQPLTQDLKEKSKDLMEIITEKAKDKFNID